jgi:hypothetical protein
MEIVGNGRLDRIFQAGGTGVIPNSVFEIHGKQPHYGSAMLICWCLKSSNKMIGMLP